MPKLAWSKPVQRERDVKVHRLGVAHKRIRYLSLFKNNSKIIKLLAKSDVKHQAKQIDGERMRQKISLD